MKPVRLRYLSEDCHDAIVEHFFRCCPVALCPDDAAAFLAVLCRIIDREIDRVVTEIRPEGPGDQGNRRGGRG